MTRGRPRYSFRSPLTITLLILLRERPLPTHVISYTLLENSRKISRYLSYLKRLGLVERDDYGYWSITELGDQFLSALELSVANIDLLREKLNENLTSLLTTIIQRNTTKILQKDYKKSALKVFDDYLKSEASFKQIILRAEKRLGRSLTETEYKVLRFLWDYERTTGRKYWWPPEPASLAESLAERLGEDSISCIGSALRELEAAGVIYMTFDKHRGVPKIRLDRSLFQA